MPWHTPERKTEQALKTYFQAVLGYELEGVQFATRFSNSDLTEPRVEIYSSACRPWSEEISPYSGNWAVDITLKVVSHYDGDNVDAEAHDRIVGNLLDQILITDDGEEAAAKEINATQFESDLQVILVDVGERTNITEDHSLVTEQALVLYIKPSNQGET